MLKEARIAAHHAIAKVIFDTFHEHGRGGWHIHVEIPVYGLRAIDTPEHLKHEWHRMVDKIEGIGAEAEAEEGSVLEEQDFAGNQQVLERLRPDAWAISWGRRQVLMLELTWAHDGNPDWVHNVEESKCRRYRRLQEEMMRSLPGWVVETVPLTVGTRGSIPVSAWLMNLTRLGVSTHTTQARFLQELTQQALDQLD